MRILFVSFFYSLLVGLTICFHYDGLAQGVSINASGIPPAPSSILDLNVFPGNDKGLLIPRMSTSERNAIPSPAAGLLVYNTSTNGLNFFHGTYWREIDHTFSSSSFGSGGVLTGDPSLWSDSILSITIDANDIFLRGYNSLTNSSTNQWKVEKRSLAGVLQWSQIGTSSVSSAMHALLQDASGRSILSASNG
jgi:hypothetical protein